MTGATGFVGRTLVAALRSRGDTVRALVRKTSREAARGRLGGLGAVLVMGDVTDEGAVTDAARGIDVVFHLASLGPTDRGATRDALALANLVGTENVLAASRAAGVRRVVYLSSEAVTRGVEPRRYVDESYPQPASFLDAYGETKALAEDLVLAAHGGGIETVAIRPGIVWGPDDTVLLPEVLRRVRTGCFAWIDGGRSLCATTYVQSLADGLVRAAAATEAGGKVYYVTDDERITMREFLGQMLTGVGVTVPRVSVPFGLAYTVATVAERVSARAVVRRAEVSWAGRSFHFNIQRARRDLGYTPKVTVAEGMARLRTWVASVGVDAIARGTLTERPPAG